MFAGKESRDRKAKVFKTGTNVNHQTTVSAIKRPPKRRHLYIDSVSATDITEICKKKGFDILWICEVSRVESRLKCFHCVFKFDNDQVESPDFCPENVSFSQFCLNRKAREWLASFATSLSSVKICLLYVRWARNKTLRIRSLIEANDFNLIVLTETWIKDSSNDEFYLQQC